MTLKTGVITAKKFSCPITEINYIQLAKIFNNIFLKSFFELLNPFSWLLLMYGKQHHERSNEPPFVLPQNICHRRFRHQEGEEKLTDF